MDRIQLAIEGAVEPHGEPVVLDVLDAATALIVAEINIPSGSAELWKGKRKLARLTRHGRPQATFWEVSRL